MMSRQNPAKPDWNRTGEILLVDKPPEWTSFDVVKKIRSLFGIRKIGHAGTLDPQATGLLILGTGPKTKELGGFMSWEKEYTGTLELGVVTPSYDSETPVIERRSIEGVTEAAVHDAARQFIGKQVQTPPMFSAVKHGGKPLYKYARKGRTVPRAERTIEIREFEVTRIALPLVHVRVVCSKGTYIRALAYDFGETLECGATLRVLRRTRIGTAVVEDAFTVEELQTLKAAWGRQGRSEHAYHTAESRSSV